MSITITTIEAVRAHIAKRWHDQSWHDFNAQPEVEAVRYALSEAAPDDTDEDIAKSADAYLAAAMKG